MKLLRDELNVPTITLVTVFGPFSSVSKPVTSVVSSLPAGSCNRTGSCSSSTTPVTAPVAHESGNAVAWKQQLMRFWQPAVIAR